MKRIFTLLLSVFLVVPIIPANAEELPGEVLLGIFFSSEEDQTDTLYVSFDGERFERIATVLEDMNKESFEDNDTRQEEGYQVNCLHDPALQYHDGVYWSMSGWTRRTTTVDDQGNAREVADKYVPMLSWSKDLIEWSYPNVGSSNGWYDPSAGVVVPKDQLPLDKNENWSNDNYDAVAPELFIDDDGSAWIVVTMGYYASWHGDLSTNDKMSPYMIRLKTFGPGNSKADQPRITYSEAKRINLPDSEKNRIDAHIYKENGTYYLSIKRNGVTNEIWSIKNLNDFADAGKWTKVCDNVVTGYEGPSLTKFQGKYYMYTDKLADYSLLPEFGTTRVFVTESSSLSHGWNNTRRITTVDENGNAIANRHGSVYCITEKAQIEKIMKLYRKLGYTGSIETPKKEGWYVENGHEVWYENGVKQGTSGRGKEIFDPASNAWYWLDAPNGYKAVSKDVFQDSLAGPWAEKADGTGKWVRYDANGHMIKGWDTNAKGNSYYFDKTYGTMAKGTVSISGNTFSFHKDSGILLMDLQWLHDSSGDYWYENNVRQGYDPNWATNGYRGKEIYDPASKAWYWLDSNANGKKAVSKDVYQPYTYQGKDNIGKWVRYDKDGRMIKGWSHTDQGTYYFDPITGAMLKGTHTIEGYSYTFDEVTGILVN